MSRPLRILVEGNIGAGKSTLLRSFKGHENIKTYEENVSLWTNVGGHNLLEKFYKEPAKYAYMFHTIAFHSQMKDIITNTKDEGSKDTESSMNEVYIYERSPYSSFYVFIENNKNLLSKVEYAALEEHFKLLTEKPGINFKPDLIIYLYTEPETALKRLKQRGRLEESNITLEFIEKNS